MARSFACPECGTPVAPRGHSAGLRRRRCQECGTLVEIPFLPRARAREVRGSRFGPGWTWAGLGIVAAVLMVVGAVEIARSRGRAAREGEIAGFVSASETAEAAGRFEEALARVESARKVARPFGPSVCVPLKERRDRLALFATPRPGSPGRPRPPIRSRPCGAPGQGRDGRRTRAGAGPGRRGPVGRPVRGPRPTWPEASRALASGHPDMALVPVRAGRQGRRRAGVRSAGGVKEAARAVAATIIGRYGVTFEPVTGEFLQGPSTARVHAESPRADPGPRPVPARYLPRPRTSAFLSVWDESAPYRVAISVVERNDGNFFQTPLHTSRLSAQIVLKRGTAVSGNASPRARRACPRPTMTAFEQSHLSLAKTRDPAVEKRLYDDARAVLAENLGVMLKSAAGAVRGRAATRGDGEETSEAGDPGRVTAIYQFMRTQAERRFDSGAGGAGPSRHRRRRLGRWEIAARASRIGSLDRRPNSLIGIPPIPAPPDLPWLWRSSSRFVCRSRLSSFSSWRFSSSVDDLRAGGRAHPSSPRPAWGGPTMSSPR